MNPYSFLEERVEALDSMRTDLKPSTWAQALETIGDLGRWTLLGVLLTVLALRCLDVFRDLVLRFATPIAVLFVAWATISWLDLAPGELRAAISQLFKAT